MTEIRRADRAARRQALLLVVVGAAVGTVVFVALERYRAPLREWLLLEPERLVHRLRLAFLVASVAMSAPLFGFAAHIWRLGNKVIRTQQCPPAGYRVVRDAIVLRERGALARGRSFKILAVFLAIAAAVMWCLFWRLVSALIERVF